MILTHHFGALMFFLKKRLLIAYPGNTSKWSIVFPMTLKINIAKRSPHTQVIKRRSPLLQTIKGIALICGSYRHLCYWDFNFIETDIHIGSWIARALMNTALIDIFGSIYFEEEKEFHSGKFQPAPPWNTTQWYYTKGATSARCIYSKIFPHI